MNFLVLSDLHLEHAELELTVPPEADAVILAGDIAEGTAGIHWAKATFPGLPVIYVSGNHEFYGGEVGQVATAMREAAEGSNVLLLEKASTVIGGVRLLGTTLWTGFDLFAGEDETELAWAKADARRYVPDFNGRIRCFAGDRDMELSPDITAGWHRKSVAWLQQELAKPFTGPTVVVTHHAPSLISVPEEYARHPATPAWASPLDKLVEQADVWVHGHVHQCCNYELGACRVVSNPRGYDGESKYFASGRLVKV